MQTLECGSEDRRQPTVWGDRAHMAVGRDEKQVSMTKHTRAERDFPGNNLKDCKLCLGICRTSLIQRPPLNSKIITGRQCLVLRLPKSWLKVTEIDASERLFDVDRPRLAVQPEP